MRIRRSHHLGLAEAKLRAEKIAAYLEKQYAMRWSWHGDHMHVQGNGVNGQLMVEEEALELNVRLGFALKLMEGPIRSAIEQAIDKELAGA
jgi:putative polyhydroxyalkanoate system protein